jgi:hypothetical protein
MRLNTRKPGSIMVGQTTRIAPQMYKVTAVRVPEQVSGLIRDAHENARKLGGKLASFDSIVMDMHELQKSNGNYLVAADPANIPKQEGWYRVDRNTSNSTITFVPVTVPEADLLRRAGRMFDALYVNQNAVNAAAVRHPVALVVINHKSGSFLGVDGWPDNVARVALESPIQVDSVSDAQNAELESLRRVDIGPNQKLVFVHSNGVTAEVQVPEGTTVHIVEK